MIDSLTHGDDLFAILIEGGNPHADGPLTEREQSQLQEQGLDAATLHALVIGRVVMGGRGVWALGSDRIVVLGHKYRGSVERVPLTDVTHAESEQGRYGETVRLQTRQGGLAMYGADPARARRLVEHLSAARTAAA